MKNNHYGTRRVAEVNQAPYQVVQWEGAFAVADMDEYMNDNKESSVIVIDEDFNKLRVIVDRLNKKYGEAFAKVVHKPNVVELTQEADAVLELFIEDRKRLAFKAMEQHPLVEAFRSMCDVDSKMREAYDYAFAEVQKTAFNKDEVLNDFIISTLGSTLAKTEGGVN